VLLRRFAIIPIRASCRRVMFRLARVILASVSPSRRIASRRDALHETMPITRADAPRLIDS
jgi:hypothetical protein